MADETGPQDALTGIYENPSTGAFERRKIRTTDGGATLVVQRIVEREVIDNAGAYIYYGFAPWGTDTSAAGWKILRDPVSGSLVGPTERADGDDNYDNVWDNRATLPYVA